MALLRSARDANTGSTRKGLNEAIYRASACRLFLSHGMDLSGSFDPACPGLCEKATENASLNKEKLCIAMKGSFKLNFVVYKTAYKQMKARMQKKEPKVSKSQKQPDLALIKTDPDFPMQELLCREEHKELFEDLCKGKNHRNLNECKEK